MSVQQPFVRWGIASTAKVNRHFLAAIRFSNIAKVCAVASRSQTTADDYARVQNIPLAFGSYEAMFQSSDIDCVYVSVPDGLHKTVSMAALRHGKHVLCEKPMALTLHDVQEMYACAAEHNVLLAEAVMSLHSNLLRNVRDEIDKGVIGDILAMHGQWSMHGGPAGGSVPGLGSYGMNVARFLSRNVAPVSVSCHSLRRWEANPPAGNSGSDVAGGGPSNTTTFTAKPTSARTELFAEDDDLVVVADAAATFTMRFPTFVANFLCSACGPAATEFTVVGTQGTITIPSPFKPAIRGATYNVVKSASSSSPRQVEVAEKEDIGHLYQLEIDELSRHVLQRSIIASVASGDGDDHAHDDAKVEVCSGEEEQQLLLSPQFSMSGGAVMEALLESMRNGGQVTIVKVSQ